MTLAPMAPAWPARVIAVASDPGAIARGRPAEFRQAGLMLDGTPSVAAALVEIGRERDALVLVPSDLDAMPLLDFVEVVHAISDQRVIIGIAPHVDAEAVADAIERGMATAVPLPVTAARLASAVTVARPLVPVTSHLLEVGALEVDTAAYRVRWHGAEVRLAPRLIEMVHYFATAYPRVVSMPELAGEFGSSDDARDRGARARVSIGRIRHLFATAHPGGLQPLETVHRVGYRLSAGGVPGPSPR